MDVRFMEAYYSMECPCALCVPPLSRHNRRFGCGRYPGAGPAAGHQRDIRSERSATESTLPSTTMYDHTRRPFPQVRLFTQAEDVSSEIWVPELGYCTETPAISWSAKRKLRTDYRIFTLRPARTTERRRILSYTNVH